jgi:hypothetical protein
VKRRSLSKRGHAVGQSPSRARRCSWKRALRQGVALTGAVVVACSGWEDWDRAFRRRYYGWKSSDAGSTIVLPGNRLLWIFGDTVVHPDNVTSTDEEGFIFGNTIAVHTLQSPASVAPLTQDTDRGGFDRPGCYRA